MGHAGFPNGLGQSAESIAENLKNHADDVRRRLIIEIDDTAVGETNYRNKGDGVAEIGIKICDFSSKTRATEKSY